MTDKDNSGQQPKPDASKDNPPKQMPKLPPNIVIARGGGGVRTAVEVKLPDIPEITPAEKPESLQNSEPRTGGKPERSE